MVGMFLGLSDLGENESLWAAAVQAQHEADGLEKLLDAGAELFLLHATGGSRVQDPRLDYELEQILQCLEAERFTIICLSFIIVKTTTKKQNNILHIIKRLWVFKRNLLMLQAFVKISAT